MSDRLVLLLSLLLLLLLPTPYRQRAKGTRNGVLAVGGNAVHFFVSILERVQTMGARCHAIPECTRYYIPVPVYDTRYQVLDKHAPRIPEPNISCCSIILAVAAASATILTLQYNSISRPNRIPIVVPGMTTRARQTKSNLEHKQLHPSEALRMPLASGSPAAKR